MSDLKLNKKNVLLAEDEEIILDSLKDAFEHHGAKVISSPDGQDAIFKLQNQKFDMIITDINMPKVNGIEFIHEVRNNYDIPIIVITGVLVNTLEDIMKYENVFIIQKPFSFDKVPFIASKLFKS